MEQSTKSFSDKDPDSTDNENNIHAWYSHKENMAPLERGRNANKISINLSQQNSPSSQRRQNARITQFESLVCPSEDPGFFLEASPNQSEDRSDVLIHWLSYIKFMQDTFPSATQPIFLLLERCTRALLSSTKYHNDVRFIRVCVLYADKTSCAMDVYKFLYSKKVGAKTALFWVAWAWVAEKQNDFKFCEKIFLKGINKKAHPLKMLETRHKQFQRRMSRHFLNTQASENDSFEESSSTRRTTLQSLTDSRVRSNNRSYYHTNSLHPQRTNTGVSGSRQENDGQDGRVLHRRDQNSGARAHSNSSNSTSQSTFQIFVDQENQDGFKFDDENAHSYHRTRVLAKQSDRNKENNDNPIQWNERGGLKSNESSEHVNDMAHIRRRPISQAGPKFELFVDENCASESGTSQKRTTGVRSRSPGSSSNSRSLRQRLEDGVADKLAKDPLRYVRNPEKLKVDVSHCNPVDKSYSRGQQKPWGKMTDQVDETVAQGINHKKSSLERKEILCVEEERVRLRCYQLMTGGSNINLLMDRTDVVDISIDESSVMSIDMEDSTAEVHCVEDQTSSSRSRNTLFPIAENITTAGDTDVEHNVLNVSNISNASSVLNERDAVGVSGTEETVNTKFAMRELSMMFSSPGAAIDSYDKINESKVMPNKTFFSATDNSFATQKCTNKAHVSDGNTTFSIMADLNLSGCENNKNQNAANDFLTNSDNMKITSKLPFTIHTDENDCDYDLMKEKPKSSLHFKIHSDDCNIPNVTTNTKQDTSLPFTIHSDSVDSIINKSKKNGEKSETFEEEVSEENSNTATLSLLNEAIASPPKDTVKTTARMNGSEFSLPFTIHQDKTEDSAGALHQDTADDNGETATFSLFNEAIASSPVLKQNYDGTNSLRNFSIIEENDTVESVQGKQNMLSDGDTATFSIFNDALGDEDLSDVEENKCAKDTGSIQGIPSKISSPLRRQQSSDTSFPIAIDQSAVDYKTRHQKDIAEAMVLTMHEANTQVCTESQIPSDPLSRSSISDRRDIPMPKGLLDKKPKKGTELILAGHKVILKHELGRGAYGVVMLCYTPTYDFFKTKSTHSSTNKNDPKERVVAMKIQSPTGSLAWEYLILKRLFKRLTHSGLDVSCYPFPNAAAFANYSNGAVLGMTAGSNSGLTLLDIVNLHKSSGLGPVPELLAVHYTARMLEHLESLHRHGKILHCDIKPDNWVLSTTKQLVNNTDSGLIMASDLMLVDFGRAIDLMSFTEVGSTNNPLNIRFSGDISADGMSCGAMKSGRPWATDADTFGLCASAHVLLFGSYMDVDFVESVNKWTLQRPLRRYWQKTLWGKLFDTLLNPGEQHRGSHPDTLRSIRKSFEEYLDEKNRRKEVLSLLKFQSGILPKKRT